MLCASTTDLDNRHAPLLTQIDSHILHIEAGLLWCAAGQEANETAYLILGSISKIHFVIQYIS